MAQLLEHSVNMHTAPTPHKPPVLLLTWNPTTGEAKAGGSEVQGHSMMQSEFRASMVYIISCCKREKSVGKLLREK